MAKDCKIVLNSPPREVYFPGSEVSGILSFELDGPETYKNIQVSLIGEARVSWSESSGSGQNQVNRTYTSNEIYVGLSTIVWLNEQEGMNSFPFQFQIPADRLPSSFQGSTGWIQYYVEGGLAPLYLVDVVIQ